MFSTQLYIISFFFIIIIIIIMIIIIIIMMIIKSGCEGRRASLPADVLWGFVCHAFSPWGRNECVTNEPQRTSAGRLSASFIN